MKKPAFLILLLLLLACLCGCVRTELFDMAKYGVDLIYGLGNDGTSTKVYIVRDGYYKKYDTGISFIPTMMAASGNFIVGYNGTPYTSYGDPGSSWNSLTGSPTIQFMVGYKDEIVCLDVTNLFVLHEDSYTKSNPFEDFTNISTGLGSYSPLAMFAAYDTGAVYIIGADVASFKVFSVWESGIADVVTPNTYMAGSAAGAGKKGGYFYMFLNSSNALIKMSASDPNDFTAFSSLTGIVSMAVNDSGVYLVFVSADVHFQKLNESTGVATDITVFTGATGGQILPYDRDGIALRIEDTGTNQGIWIYKDGKLKHLVTDPVNAMYVR